MPFSSGTYSLPSGNPVVTGTTISSTTTNTTNSDIATALSSCILKDGTQTVTANIPMASHKITGLAAPTTAGDALAYGSPINTTAITGITTPLSAAQGGTGFVDSVPMFRNRIINGGMVIAQRNAGASVTVTASGAYGVDRWLGVSNVNSKFSIQQNAGAVTPPVGFNSYLGTTSLSAYSLAATEICLLQHKIEGFNFSDFAWGTASAKTITISAQVYSSLTGTFGGSLRNSVGDRSYPFSYSIPVANTWTTISIVIAGDTSGTWVGATNGVGLELNFSIGAGTTFSGTAGAWSGNAYFSATGAVSVVGTSGATFYITGVQLEKGSVATSFDYRPYGTELALCQRYYFKNIQTSTILAEAGFAPSTTLFRASTKYPVPMRTAPTALEQTGIATDYRVLGAGASTTTCNSVPTFSAATEHIGQTNFPVAAGLTAYSSGAGSSANTITAYLGWSAEL